MILKQIPEDFIVEEIPLVKPSEEGDYFLYKLKKKYYNTETIIQNLSKKYNIQRKLFSYSGTKDKNAVTTQYFSVKKELPNIKEENYEIKKLGKIKKPLSLGDHLGNRFIITIKDIDKSPEYKTEFINYFGEQRFGKHNFEIGLALLKKDFQTAVSLVDLHEVQQHLVNNPNDYIGALQKVPFKILKIYVHSVQSFFWNKIAEKIDVEEIPFIAFDTEFENKAQDKQSLSGHRNSKGISSEIEKEYEKLLGKYSLSQRDFVIRQFQNLTPQGDTRKRIAQVKELKIGKLESDELNENKKKVIVEFILPKGSYATVFIKSLFV